MLSTPQESPCRMTSSRLRMCPHDVLICPHLYGVVAKLLCKVYIQRGVGHSLKKVAGRCRNAWIHFKLSLASVNKGKHGRSIQEPFRQASTQVLLTHFTNHNGALTVLASIVGLFCKSSCVMCIQHGCVVYHPVREDCIVWWRPICVLRAHYGVGLVTCRAVGLL